MNLKVKTNKYKHRLGAGTLYMYVLNGLKPILIRRFLKKT